MGDFLRTPRPFQKRSKRSLLILSASNTSLQQCGIGHKGDAMGRKSVRGEGCSGGGSKDGKKSLKRGSIKERWLLTRKTWKYMTDAGRRLIPDGFSNRPEDIPKIEEYFQEICRNEPRFLVWRRKCSYPGALPSSIRRKKRIKLPNSAPASTKASSADEAEEELAELAESAQYEDMMINMLKNYLNIRDSGEDAADGDGRTPAATTINDRQTSANRDSGLAQKTTRMTPHSDEPTVLSHKGAVPKVKMRPQSTTEMGSDAPFALFGGGSTIATKQHSSVLRNTTPSSAAALYDNLKRFKDAHKRSKPSIMDRITPEVLNDKTALRQIYDELNSHKINRMMRKTAAPSLRFQTSKHHEQHPLGLHSFSNLSLFSGFSGLSKHSSRSSDDKSSSKYPEIQLSSTEGGTQPVNLSYDTNDEDQGQDTFAEAKTKRIVRIKTFTDSGIQTDTIPIALLNELSTNYRKQLELEEKQRREDELDAEMQQQQQHQQQHVTESGEVPGKGNRRKSSIDNEDVSQSVSDTIKRYLRMARKKPPKEDPNRFKRINYDRNLRNIKAKGEITKIGDDDGDMKGCQTEDDWIIRSFTKLSKAAAKAALEPAAAPVPAPSPPAAQTTGAIRPSTLPRWKAPNTATSKQQSSPTSGSSPSSPGLFHSSTQFLSNLFSHSSPANSSSGSITQVDSNDSNVNSLNDLANMQKSKSSSNVGSIVSRKIWKSRSKSQTRPSSPAKPQWTPQGNCIWSSSEGRCIQLKESILQSLTEVERKMLHRVAIGKINQFNIGVNVAVPLESSDSQAQKPQKKRALLLKRRALTTSFFDSNKDENKSGQKSGQVFGISLEQCLNNESQQNKIQKSATCKSMTERVSRNSLSSLADSSSGPNEVPGTGGSCESLPSRAGTIPALLSERLKGSLSQFDVRRGSHDEDEDYGVIPGSGVVLEGLERSNREHVPALIIACVQHLEKYGLNTIGLFRKSTSKKRVRQLREEFDQGNNNLAVELDSAADVSPHDVATLLKEYLRDLPEPLLCRSLYQAFVNTQKIRNRRLQLEAIAYLVQLLPVAHRDTLFYLLRFLAKVARYADDVQSMSGEVISEGNKMDSNNLATVFAPNILHNAVSSQITSEEVEERIDVINVIRAMIDHYEELFRIPPELMDEIYTNMIDAYPSQLDYLCDRWDSTNMNRHESDTSEMSTMSPTSPPPALHLHQAPVTTMAEILEAQKQKRIYAREEFLHENSMKGRRDEGLRRDRSGKGRSGQGESTSASTENGRRRLRPVKNLGSEAFNSRMDENLAGKTRSSSIDSETAFSPGFEMGSGRRMSSPFVLNNNVLTASLKIPVQGATSGSNTNPFPLNVGDEIMDIPFIEDSCGYGGGGGGGGGGSPLHEDRGGESSQTTSSRSSKKGLAHIFMSRDKSSRKNSRGTITGTLSLVQSPSSITTSTSTSPDCSRHHVGQIFFGEEDFPEKIQPSSSSSVSSKLIMPRSSQQPANANYDLPKSTSLFSVGTLGMATSAKRQSDTKKPDKQKLSIAPVTAGLLLSSSTSSGAPQYAPEPRVTASISSIGGSVLRSKTADFERLYTSTADQQRSTQQQQQQPQPQPPSLQPKAPERKRGQLYKRSTLIASTKN